MNVFGVVTEGPQSTKAACHLLVTAVGGIGLLWIVRRQWRQFLFRRYLRDHPYTIRIDQHHNTRLHSRTWWKRATHTILYSLWTLLSIFVFGSCAALGLLGSLLVSWIRRAVKAAHSGLNNVLRSKHNDKASRTTKSDFIFAPTVSQSRTQGAEPRPTTPQIQTSSKSQHRVSFSEHSNGQVRHTQFSYDPKTPQKPPTVQESRTPPPPGTSDWALEPLLPDSRHLNQVRYPHTPPLPRKRRSQQQQTSLQPAVYPSGGEKENDAPYRKSSAYAIPRRTQEYASSTLTAAATSEPPSSATPVPVASQAPADQWRKRRAPHEVNAEFSPAVKRMYGRLRLPRSASLAAHLTQGGLQLQQQRILASDRKLKRRREHEQALWEAFQAGNRQKTVPSVGQDTSDSTCNVPLPLQVSEPAARQESIQSSMNRTPVDEAPAPTFHFGSSTPAASLPPVEPAAQAPFQFGATSKQADTDTTPSTHATTFQFASTVGTSSAPGSQSSSQPGVSTQPAEADEAPPANGPVFKFGSNGGVPATLPSVDDPKKPAVQPAPVPKTPAATARTPDPIPAETPASQSAFRFGATPSLTPLSNAGPACLLPSQPTGPNTSLLQTTASFGSTTTPVGFPTSGALPPPSTTFQFGSNPTQTQNQDLTQQAAATPTFQFGAEANKTQPALLPTSTTFQLGSNQTQTPNQDLTQQAAANPSFQFGAHTNKTQPAGDGGGPSTGTPAFQFGSAALPSQPTFNPPIPPNNPFAVSSNASVATPPFQFGAGNGSGAAVGSTGATATSNNISRRRGTPQTRRRR